MRWTLGLTSVLCLSLQWAVLAADEAQDKAAVVIEKLGGKIQRDIKRPGSPVVSVDLSHGTTKRPVKDADLACLRDLAELEKLKLDDQRVTDEGLKQLKGLKKLRSLTLSFTATTDEGLKHLTGLSRLEFLDVGYCAKVTKKGKEELRKSLPKLEIFGP